MEEQKKLKWAIASLIFGVLALLVLICSGYGYQWNWWKLMTAFTWLIPGSALLGILGLVSAMVYWLSRKDNPERTGASWVMTGFLLSVLVIGGLGYLLYQAKQYPPIHDISTDVINPPKFHAIVSLRTDAQNDTRYGGKKEAKIQHEHYPYIKPLYLKVGYAKAFDRALKAAQRMPWEKIETFDKNMGVIEATDKLPWFGFQDDIVIRIETTKTNGSVKIDVRSVSRIGKGDLGVNAQRIRDYLDEVRSSD